MKVRSVIAALVFVFVATLMTLVGWYFALLQVHNPDWKGSVSIALLLPYILVDHIFARFHQSHPSRSPFDPPFVLGSVGQLLYYFGIFSLIRLIATRLQRSFRGGR